MEANQVSFLIPLRILVLQLSQQPVDPLPPVVLGMLSSLLPPLAAIEDFRSAVAARLRATSDRAVWFQHAELAEVCAALDGLHAYDLHLVSGADIAALTQRLLTAETDVGGPYRESDGMTYPSTNAFVQQALAWMAEPLPNVSSLLAGADKSFEDTQLTAAEKTLLYTLQCPTDKEQPAHVAQLQAYAGLLVAALAAQIVYESEQEQRANDVLATYAQSVHARSQKLPVFQEPFRSKTAYMLHTVMQADGNHEIATLAWMYGQAYAQINPPLARPYAQFGTANVYAWIAYTIYDDFLDEEGDPSLLGTANYCLRACLREYHAALPNMPAFQSFVEQTLAVVDTANTYETTHLRLATTPTTITIDAISQYETVYLLADRALFHVIGPMGVLAATGEAIGSTAWNQTLLAFRHYLIARQLNDDIHDWVEDLRAGQISFVVASLLWHLGATPGVYNLDELLAYARPVFWQEVLPTICTAALEHIAQAKQMPFPNRDSFANSRLMQLFTYVESSMHAANEQRTNGQDFLKHFTGAEAA